MSKLRFTATIDLEAWKAHWIAAQENLILLRYHKEAKPRIREQLVKITEKNKQNLEENKEPVQLDVEIDIYYRPRSIQSNKLMWALYTVLADLMNAEAKTMDRITEQELYDEDMENWAIRHTVFCLHNSKSFFIQILEKEKGHVKRVEWNKENGLWEIEVWQTSSYWNTKQQANHITRLFNLLEEMGKNKMNNGDIAAIYADFQKWEKKNCEENT